VLTRVAQSLVVALVAPACVFLSPGQHASADVVRDRQQPLLNALDIPRAWRTTKGAGATVAIVDSGVAATHPDLRGSVTVGPNMLADIDRGSTPTRNHGTGMASLIVGHGHGPGRGSGIVGLAPEARALAVRSIAEPEDAGFLAYRRSERAEGAVARGIRWATDRGADVINLSLGKYREDPEDRKAIAYAINKGVVVISAVGNDGDKGQRFDDNGHAPYSFPASYPGVIAVAATDTGHNRARFSNRNYSVLLAAPGVSIPAAAPDGAYYLTDGTSNATALVSGIAALIRARYRDLPPALVAQALLASTRYNPSGGYDPAVGFGEVNAARALSAAGNLVKTAKQPAGGLRSSQRFTTEEPGPVTVIDRPAWTKPVAYGAVALAVLGVVLAFLVALKLFRRAPRGRRREAMPFPPAQPHWPPPSAPRPPAPVLTTQSPQPAGSTAPAGWLPPPRAGGPEHPAPERRPMPPPPPSHAPDQWFAPPSAGRPPARRQEAAPGRGLFGRPHEDAGHTLPPEFRPPERRD
jgi:type VII secretion-associated serine protease mycosin